MRKVISYIGYAYIGFTMGFSFQLVCLSVLFLR